METSSHKEIEYIDGSVPLLNDEYHQEAVEKYQQLPRNSTFPTPVSLSQSKQNLRDETKALKALIECGKQLRKKAEANGYVEKIRQKKRTVTDNDRKEIERFYKELGDKVDYKAIARILDKNPSTIRKLLERVKRGESIERSKVKRGRHRIVDGHAAELLDDYFIHHNNTSDEKAAMLLKENGYAISRSSVQRAVTNGTMEAYGYKSLTMQHVYFRGKNAESEENKEAGKMLLLSYSPTSMITIIPCLSMRLTGKLDGDGEMHGIEGEKRMCRREVPNATVLQPFLPLAIRVLYIRCWYRTAPLTLNALMTI